MSWDWTHVYPTNDKFEHDISGPFCMCEPEYDWENHVVIHNAWDMREAQEFINQGIKGR